MWNLKINNLKIKLIDAENRLVVARVEGWEMGEMGELFSFFSLNKLH